MPSKEETKTNLVSIFKKIVEICNAGTSITFESDFGDNTLTVIIDDNHIHIGSPDGSFDTLIIDLHKSLQGGAGLTWDPVEPEVLSKTKE